MATVQRPVCESSTGDANMREPLRGRTPVGNLTIGEILGMLVHMRDVLRGVLRVGVLVNRTHSAARATEGVWGSGEQWVVRNRNRLGYIAVELESVGGKYYELPRKASALRRGDLDTLLPEHRLVPEWSALSPAILGSWYETGVLTSVVVRRSEVLFECEKSLKDWVDAVPVDIEKKVWFMQCSAVRLVGRAEVKGMGLVLCGPKDADKRELSKLEWGRVEKCG